MEKFTQQETEFLLGQMKKWQISPLAPDAVGVCQMLQSIAAKMRAMTEEPESDSGAESGA